MKILILGATGATGQHLLKQLLNCGNQVIAIVRSSNRIPLEIRSHEKLTLIEGNALDIDQQKLGELLKDCDGAASCLGHNLNLKGIYGKPRKLVRDSVRQVCENINKTKLETPFRFVLMNTSGNRNRDLNEPASIAYRIVISIIRLLLPPQTDNEKAADYLRTKVGQNSKSIEWVAVRPDSLINESEVSDYEAYPSPIRNPIFNPGKTSRINVGHFMAELINNTDLWKQWKGQMPVIYNKVNSK